MISSPPEPPLFPRALRPGARVALVAPAGPLDPARIAAAEERCRALGFEPVTAPGAHRREGFLAGPDADRLADLQAAFDDPKIDAVWALRGGYGSHRIVDALDLRRQLGDPIPFIGFSDNTALHARHTALGVVSFHGPHPTLDDAPEADVWLRRLLTVDEPPGALPDPADAPLPRPLCEGRARGRLTGGNLALLASLCGTRDAVSGRGRILVVEDVGEPAYRIDRMLVQLQRAGVLDGVAGLAFGRFTGVSDEEGPLVAEALRRFAEAVGVAALVDLPFGHVSANCALPLGALAELDADAGTLTVVESGVA